MQGNTDEEKRHNRFSDNYRESYFKWPRMLTKEQVPLGSVLLVVWRSLLWAFATASQSRSFTSRVFSSTTFICASCSTCACVQPLQESCHYIIQTTSALRSAASLPGAVKYTWNVHCGGCFCCLHLGSRLKTQYKSAKGKLFPNQQFSFQNSGLESRKI